jgi:hypothetical protein
MFQTAFTLSLTQFARTLSLPERLQRTPARNLSLEALRQRNTTLDALFYDIKVITPEEAFYISDSLAAEGSILIVPPSGAGALILCDTLEEFVLRGGRDVRILAVAGIGGSALGSAAFARNIADATGQAVAVVVSGYGLSDLMAEAFGGHFFFGPLSGLRHAFEILDEISGRPKLGAAFSTQSETKARTRLDTKTVRALLDDPRLSFHLLTGHSKGNLVLSEALYGLEETNLVKTQMLAETTRIVSFGARIAMPAAFAKVTAVLGEWDWFGEMNSRPSLPTDRRVPLSGHHTNTDLPGHLPVTDTLRGILVETPDRMESATENEPPSPPAQRPVRRPAKATKAKVAISKTIPPEVTALETRRANPSDQPKPH